MTYNGTIAVLVNHEIDPTRAVAAVRDQLPSTA
jgi:hypothetical protein